MTGPACLACGASGRLVNDHCHEHGLERGTLCTRCNLLMSYVDRGYIRQKWAHMIEALRAHWLRCPACASGAPRPIEVTAPTRYTTICLTRATVDLLRHLERQLAAAADVNVTHDAAIRAACTIALAPGETA